MAGCPEEDERLARWFERLLNREFRPLIATTTRVREELYKLSPWQLNVLAVNLDVTTALTALGRSYEDLPLEEKCRLIHEELRSCDQQWRGHFSKDSWTPLMLEYFERTNSHVL